MLKPTAHLTIDSTKVDPLKLEILEGVIHGTEHSEPRLPMPWEVYDLLGNDPPLGIYQEPEHVDNNLLVKGRDYTEDTTHRTIFNTGVRLPTGEPIWEATKMASSSPPVHLPRVPGVDLEPGVTYTLSVWHYSQSPGAQFFIGFYDTASKSFLTSYPHSNADEEWSFRQVSSTIPDTYEGDGISVYLYPFGTTLSPQGTVAYFSSPKLEIGTEATPMPKPSSDVWGYRDVNYATGHDLRGYKDEGIYRLHENSKLTEQGVGLYGL